MPLLTSAKTARKMSAGEVLMDVRSMTREDERMQLYQDLLDDGFNRYSYCEDCGGRTGPRGLCLECTGSIG